MASNGPTIAYILLNTSAFNTGYWKYDGSSYINYGSASSYATGDGSVTMSPIGNISTISWTFQGSFYHRIFLIQGQVLTSNITILTKHMIG